MCKVRPNSADAIFLIDSKRHYETDVALQMHWKSKVHKRRVKQLKVPAYTIEESELAAGLGRETRRTAATQPVDVVM